MTDSEIKERILVTAKEFYFEHGFAKSTMDDLAHNLRMSKKTIYKYFQSKDEIVREITREKLRNMHACCIDWHTNKSMDFLERIRLITQFLSNEMRKLKPVFYLDLQRTMPDVWKEVNEFRSKSVFEDFKKMVLEGVELGVIRSDINVDVLVLMYASAMQTIINPETLATLPLNASQAYDAIVDIVFSGVFSEQAKKKYILTPNVSTIKEEEIHS